jgi:hypothetical protein
MPLGAESAQRWVNIRQLHNLDDLHNFFIKPYIYFSCKKCFIGDNRAISAPSNDMNASKSFKLLSDKSATLNSKKYFEIWLVLYLIFEFMYLF